MKDYVYKFSARFLKNFLKMRLPQKNYFTQKVSLPKKFYPEKWVFPDDCVFIKKSVSPEKRVTPEKMFHLKILTIPKKVFKRMQHLCVDSEFSKPHFSKST